MRDRIHVVNAERLKISLVAYLIIEYMHYYDVKLNFMNPKGIGFIGLNEKLFRYIVSKVLFPKKYVRKSKDGLSGDFVLTALIKNRMDKMLGTKENMEHLFETEIWKIYPNKTGKKMALISFMKIPFNDSSNNIQDIIDGIENRKLWVENKPVKEWVSEWPHLSTYLNGERWNDVLKPWDKDADKEQNTIEYKPKNKIN